MTKDQNLSCVAAPRQVEFKTEMVAKAVAFDNAGRGEFAGGFNDQIIDAVYGSSVVAGRFAFDHATDEIDGLFLFLSSLDEK